MFAIRINGQITVDKYKTLRLAESAANELSKRRPYFLVQVIDRKLGVVLSTWKPTSPQAESTLF